MNDTGWIKLHRKFLNWEWYGDANVVATFIHLLLDANWEDKKWRGILIKRGSFITSISGLAESIGISIQQTRTALDKLISTNEITRSTSSNYTCISINNYDKYQQVTKSLTNEQQTNNKRITTTKEYKNIRNKENNIYISPERIKEISEKYKVLESSVKTIYEDLILYCKSKGKKYSDYEATLMNWVRRAISEGKIKNIKPTFIPEGNNMTEEERLTNLHKIEEIKSLYKNKLHL